MTRNNIKFFVVLILFISCNSKQQDNIQNRAKRDSLNNGLVDTLNYTTENSIFIPPDIHWNDTLGLDSPAYYIDTFSISRNRFRIIHFLFNKSNYPVLEKFINGQWVKQIEVENFNGSGDLAHSVDVNYDGYKDITLNALWGKKVYFFDKAKNDFTDTVSDITNELFLLDTARKIFCDFEELKQMCGQIHSKLYTYNGTVRQNLYDLELYNCKGEGYNTPSCTIFSITKLILSKCIKRKLYNPIYFEQDSLIELKTIHLSKPIKIDDNYSETSYFDYVDFWKKNYKQLMGYSQH